MSPPPVPGTPIEALDTPALLIDLDIAEANLRGMQAFLSDRGKALRAHAKFHKSAYWGARQVEAGAIGVCVAKLGEAEAMVEGGIHDVLIANEVVGAAKIARLAAIAGRARLTVAVDDAENARDLSAAAVAHGVRVGVLVDVNVRLNRCGVEPGAPTAALAAVVADLPGLEFAGLMGYEGHVRGDPESRRAETMAAMRKLEDAIRAVEQAGLSVGIVSAGGTSTCDITAAVPGVTELQCGSYLFMDAAYHAEVPAYAPALSVLASVMSRPAADRAILDTGFKSVSIQVGLPRLHDLAGGELEKLNAEHGILRLDGEGRRLRVGARVRLLPMKGEATINLHDEYFCVRNGKLEAVVPIDARGRSR